jgi:hypothetical protein
MTVDAYLVTIKSKTGKTPDDFIALARERGLTSHGQLVAWLKNDHGLGHGHANLIAHLIRQADEQPTTTDQQIDAHFTSNKAHWRETYDALVAQAGQFGPDFRPSPVKTYINFLRGDKKFAIVTPSTAERFDIGIKLKGVEPAGRLTASGSWNSMVTHRVQIGTPDEVDAEVLGWLRQAYDDAA